MSEVPTNPETQPQRRSFYSTYPVLCGECFYQLCLDTTKRRVEHGLRPLRDGTPCPNNGKFFEIPRMELLEIPTDAPTEHHG